TVPHQPLHEALLLVVAQVAGGRGAKGRAPAVMRAAPRLEQPDEVLPVLLGDRTNVDPTHLEAGSKTDSAREGFGARAARPRRAAAPKRKPPANEGPQAPSSGGGFRTPDPAVNSRLLCH